MVLLLSLCTACNSEELGEYSLNYISRIIDLDFTSAKYENQIHKGEPNIFGEGASIERYSIDNTLCQKVINDKRFRKLPIKDKNYIKWKSEISNDERRFDDPITEGYYCIINRTNQEETLDTTSMATEEYMAVDYVIVYCDPENKKLYINTFNN